MDNTSPPSSPRVKIPILTTSRTPRSKTVIPIQKRDSEESTAVIKPRNTPKNSVSLPEVPTIDTGSNSCAAKAKINIPPSFANKNTQSSNLEVEITGSQYLINDYQGLVTKSSLENELLNYGYSPISKIVVVNDNKKKVQFIKAINKKGQKVFILVDIEGFTAAKSSDMTFLESNKSSIVPYSIKNGAYNCANKDVCGVAFECGSEAVCILSREPKDLTPRESNYLFTDKNPTALVNGVNEGGINGSIMTYPVIRLSEIKANPDLLLKNTDIVIRRLRNNAYVTLLEELTLTRHAINKLNESFVKFNTTRETNAVKLNTTLTQLEKWNEMYIANPPVSDEGKDKYRRLQHNLVQRNDGIAILLQSMKKVADLTKEIDNVSKTINDVTDFCNRTFSTVEYANSE